MSVLKADFSAAERRLFNKAALRLIPFLMLCYFVSFVDRINIGFASLQMNHQLHISASAFGLGGGLFFIAYFIFEVPSNLLLEKFGARRWLARIMIVWGLVAACMAFVDGPKSFWSMRFVLGAAEAGFFPGVILYLTYWFPKAYRAQFIGWFTVAIPLSGFLGSPISAELLNVKHMLGLASWQWLYLIEGAPAVLLGICCLLFLPDKPASAAWLSQSERQVFQEILARDKSAAPLGVKPRASSWRIIFRADVLMFSVVLAGTTAVSSAYSIWTPRLIEAFAWSNMATGWLNALPFFLGAVAMVALAYTSDRSQERVWHSAVPLLLAAAGTVALLFFKGFVPFYLLINVAVIGIYACKGPAWAVVTEWLPEEGQAAGIAQVNALSNLAGFGTVYVVGYIQEATGSSALALLPLAALSVLSGAVILGLGRARGKIRGVAGMQKFIISDASENS
jgi:MFS transporter, ACS family, tartrate transporter